MENEKLYFKSIDDTRCDTLEDHIENTEKEDTEITLIEAILDNDNRDYIWCTHYGDVVERCQCKKFYCSFYSSKSGRGKCESRGNLYLHGNEVTFKL